MKHFFYILLSLCIFSYTNSANFTLSTKVFAQTNGGPSAPDRYIYGSVSEISGKPLFGALLTLYSAGKTATQKTNSAGEFGFIKKPGTYSLYGSVLGYQSNMCHFTVANLPVKVTFKLAKLGAGPSSCEAVEQIQEPTIAPTSAPTGDGTEGPSGVGVDTSTSSPAETPGSTGSSTSTGATVNADGTITSVSNCVVTKIGNPAGEATLPADCKSGNSGGGNATPIPGGGTYDGKFYYYCQGDPQWSTSCGSGASGMAACNADGEQAGYCGMGQAGCGPTSLAMIMKTFGVDINPLQVDVVFQQNGWRAGCGAGSDDHSAITSSWFTSQGFTIGPNLANGGLDLEGMKSYLDQGYIILVNANNYPCKGCVDQFAGIGHYITVDSVDVAGNRIHTRDPNNCSYSTGQENPSLAWTDLGVSRESGGGANTTFYGAFPIKRLQNATKN